MSGLASPGDGRVRSDARSPTRRHQLQGLWRVSRLLVDDTGDDNTRTSLKSPKADIDALKPEVEEIAKAINTDVDKAAKSSVSCAGGLAKGPFTCANGGRRDVLRRGHGRVRQRAPEGREKWRPGRTLPRIAKRLKQRLPGSRSRGKTPFIELGNTSTGDFDKAARQLFNIQNASTQLAGLPSFSRDALRLELNLVQVEPLQPPASLPHVRHERARVDP
jgi:hypothetical protein